MSLDFMNDPAAILQFDSQRPVTKLLHMIWTSRPDLQAAFDISAEAGQASFMDWAAVSLKREYGLDPDRAGRVSTVPSPKAATDGRANIVHRLLSLFEGRREIHPPLPLPGVTLIGYAQGVLGMGEHVRMSADALAQTDVPFGVFDVDPGSTHSDDALGEIFPTAADNRYSANLFHINADQMLPTFCRLGADFFADRYNIGFWAWELAKCPDNWLPVIDMVDEIWAPSRFIRDCFREVSGKPVTYMPLCVELPAFQKRPRSSFGLPEGDCLFLYTFDFLSYIDRKNPFAAIRAFKQGFPRGDERAGLVLKVMRGDPDAHKWQEMVALIDGDPRIHVINKVMGRGEVLALMDTCDSFLSLHRSEGFGRGPAEAMYLGKPVIATSYSGNTDFTRPGAALLVDYRLIPVEPGQYVMGEGQVWADADVDHAAELLRMVKENSADVRDVARRGQALIRDEFSNSAVGRNMRTRLRELEIVGP